MDLDVFLIRRVRETSNLEIKTRNYSYLIGKSPFNDYWSHLSIVRHNSTYLDIYVNGTNYGHKNIEMGHMFLNYPKIVIGVNKEILDWNEIKHNL